jgi:predicted LPLAT superfamily acyltransferase
MTEERQWQGKTGGGNFGQKALFFILKHIRVFWLYPVLYFVIPFYLLFSRKGTQSLRFYYKDILKYSKIKSFFSYFKNEITFGKVVLDKFAVLAGKTEQFNTHIDENDMSYFQSLLRQEKGIILAGSHVGNFELLGQCLEQDQKPISCIIFGGEGAGYQQQRDIAFGKRNIKLIPIQNDMSHLFAIKDALDKGEMIAILCDRHFGGRKIKTIKFMGEDASFPTGIFTIAAQMEIPIVSTFIMKEKRSRYQGYMKHLQLPERTSTISETMETMLHLYAASIEDILRQYPHQWFNYYPYWEKAKTK